jgi:hypothetical protein
MVAQILRITKVPTVTRGHENTSTHSVLVPRKMSSSPACLHSGSLAQMVDVHVQSDAPTGLRGGQSPA